MCSDVSGGEIFVRPLTACRDKTLVYTSPFLMGHHYGAFNKSNDDAAKKKEKKSCCVGMCVHLAIKFFSIFSSFLLLILF
jgi:hypothetical protein